MSDYINKQDVLDAFRKELSSEYNGREYAIIMTALSFSGIESILNEIKTADVRENVKGEWFVDSDGRLKCSNCLKIPINEIRIKGNLVYDMKPIKKLMKFCPNCGAEMLSGADMRGEEGKR